MFQLYPLTLADGIAHVWGIYRCFLDSALNEVPMLVTSEALLAQLLPNCPGACCELRRLLRDELLTPDRGLEAKSALVCLNSEDLRHLQQLLYLLHLPRGCNAWMFAEEVSSGFGLHPK